MKTLRTKEWRLYHQLAQILFKSTDKTQLQKKCCKQMLCTCGYDIPTPNDQPESNQGCRNCSFCVIKGQRKKISDTPRSREASSAQLIYFLHCVKEGMTRNLRNHCSTYCHSLERKKQKEPFMKMPWQIRKSYLLRKTCHWF